MDVRAFLEKFVEGYLFHDLSSLAQVRVAGPYGNCNYSMLLVELAGIELLGALTAPGESLGKEAAHFTHGWREILYADRPGEATYSEPVYKLARHGLAHTFTAKPLINVTKSGDGHLSRDLAGNLVLDVLALEQDLKAAYHLRVLPSLDDEGIRRRLQARLDKLVEHASLQARPYQGLVAVRHVESTPATAFGDYTDCSSTTYQPLTTFPLLEPRKR